jgi:hypothetical protein
MRLVCTRVDGAKVDAAADGRGTQTHKNQTTFDQRHD